MNDYKFTFVICVNNEQYYDECCYYINQLSIPDGFSTDILSIRQSESITTAYEKARQSSGAKYKIYLHQDTFLIYNQILYDILEIFKNPAVGMIGSFGGSIYSDCDIHQFWNKGHTLNGTYDAMIDFDFHTDPDTYEYVDAVDGLFMATQYDISWDTRLPGWHMYDISQCIRYKEAGLKVCVTNTRIPWTLHDSNYCHERGYDNARKTMCKLYSGYFTYSEITRDMFTDDMDTICQIKIKEEIKKKESEKYGVSQLDFLNTEDFFRFYTKVKFLIYRIAFDMPIYDWIDLLKMLKNGTISIEFFMAALSRATVDPVKIMDKIDSATVKIQ